MTTREQPELRGELRVDEPMARHTSWRTGGPVDRFYRPADAEDLCLFLSQLDSADEIFMLGLGSNLLVRDGGLRAVVIATSGCLNGFERLAGNRV
ncbi:MAG TPA: UDP-N-acetylenolpyruvoylglucosamine reductase, partial [Gammaproteobacteria bacterium]|nr:UDP-N-acetylenolpyruvoylglucosamine reductase [Gammaproteobacteria bacterium]